MSDWNEDYIFWGVFQMICEFHELVSMDQKNKI